jgi:hypothetical protein
MRSAFIDTRDVCLKIYKINGFCKKLRDQLTRVNSTNVLDEGLRIEEIGRRMNSKVRLVEIGAYQK